MLAAVRQQRQRPAEPSSSTPMRTLQMPPRSPAYAAAAAMMAQRAASMAASASPYSSNANSHTGSLLTPTASSGPAAQ